MRSILGRVWALRRVIGAYAIVLAAGWVAGDFLRDLAIPEMRPMNEPMIHRIVMGALLIFVLAAAIPFVPGAEIGFALLLLFGGKAAPIVYSGMVGALVLSFCIGRFVPLRYISQIASWLRLKSVTDWVAGIASTPAQDRPELMATRLKSRFAQRLLRSRYALLAVLLNMPGNSILGGGGGLAFLAGVSGLYRFWPYLVSVLIAVAPFPLIFLLRAS